MKKRLPLLLFPVLALILEALPYGAVLQFGRPAAARSGSCTPYFDLTPFGYANFAPLFTALAPVSCWSCWRCTPGPERTCRRSADRSGRLHPRLARSAPAGHPELFRYRCAHHGLPAGGMSLAVPRMEIKAGRLIKRQTVDESNQQAPFADAAKGACFLPDKNALQNPRFCGTMNAEINKRRDRSWQRSSALSAFTQGSIADHRDLGRQGDRRELSFPRQRQCGRPDAAARPRRKAGRFPAAEPLMRYFIPASGAAGGCYFEFQPGHWRGRFWLPGSILLADERWEALRLTELFGGVLPEFDYFGVTPVSPRAVGAHRSAQPGRGRLAGRHRRGRAVGRGPALRGTASSAFWACEWGRGCEVHASRC